jgi:hypothetical protein
LHFESSLIPLPSGNCALYNNSPEKKRPAFQPASGDPNR